MVEKVILSTKKINIQEHLNIHRPSGICNSPTGLQTRYSDGDIQITCDLCGSTGVLPERRPPAQAASSSRF